LHARAAWGRPRTAVSVHLCWKSIVAHMPVAPSQTFQKLTKKKKGRGEHVPTPRPSRRVSGLGTTPSPDGNSNVAARMRVGRKHRYPARRDGGNRS
jgi:hypothetical protein